MGRSGRSRKGRRDRVRKQKAFAAAQRRRHEVSDGQWATLKPLLPKRTAKTGRKPADGRKMLNGMLWILRSGAPWRDLPERFGPWQTVYDYFRNWRADGTFDRILQALQIRLDRQGQIDWDLWCIDGSNVRAARCAAGADKKVGAATRKNPRTTLWAARVADSAASSTWLLTVGACR
jgi:transposase